MSETTTTMIPDEVASRRPDFRGGEPIVLADGQAWYFPKPVLEFAPRFDPNAVSAGVMTSLGTEFDRLADQYDEACAAAQSGDPDYLGPRPLDVMMGIAVVMLRVNYTLGNEALSRLLRWRANNEESDERWGAIINVARGVDAPKPSADGSASR